VRIVDRQLPLGRFARAAARLAPSRVLASDSCFRCAVVRTGHCTQPARRFRSMQ
jgi:hypothetical protein